MLHKLDIKNFAIIEKTTVEFSAGLNIITGETGAGKSILIGALNLLLGAKAFIHQIKSGESEATLSANFFLKKPNLELLEKIQSIGIQISDQKELVIQRIFDLNGKSYSTVNGTSVRLQFIKSIANFLVEIHGQHEHQNILNTLYHRRIVDRFAGVQSDVQDFCIIFQEMQKMYARLKATTMNEKERNYQINLFEHEIAEIEEASLEELNEFDSLLDEEKKIKHQETILKNLHGVVQKLKRTDSSVLSGLAYVDQLLDKTLQYHRDLEPIIETCKTAYFSLEEVASAIQNQIERFSSNPERIQIVRERLDYLQSLFRKYGKTISEVLIYLEDIKLQYNELINEENKDKNLEKIVTDLLAKVKTSAIVLSKKRYNVIPELESRINRELESLYMKNIKIKISLSWNKSVDGLYEHDNTGSRYQITDTGLDRIEFFLQPLGSQKPLALRKIASGGEMSRIMLALKKVILDTEDPQSMIFDEIDTGVGGQVADAIGKKLADLSESAQVICITHLHQIASFSSKEMSHFSVKKDSDQNTSIYKLSDKNRIKEIARMISGNKVTEKEIEYAISILEEKKTVK